MVAVWQYEYDLLNNRIATVRFDSHKVSALTYGSGHVLGMPLDQHVTDARGSGCPSGHGTTVLLRSVQAPGQTIAIMIYLINSELMLSLADDPPEKISIGTGHF